MCVELGQGLKPCAEVGQVIVGTADVHDDGIKVVLALGDGKAAQEVHYKWTLAGKLVSGKANAGVVIYRHTMSSIDTPSVGRHDCQR